MLNVYFFKLSSHVNLADQCCCVLGTFCSKLFCCLNFKTPQQITGKCALECVNVTWYFFTFPVV